MITPEPWAACSQDRHARCGGDCPSSPSASSQKRDLSRSPRETILSNSSAGAGQLIEMIGMETNRGRQAAGKHLARRLARHVTYLQKELDAVDHDIGNAIKQSPAWREAEALVKSVPGIGDVTARTLLCRTT